MITRSGATRRWTIRDRGLPGLGPTGVRRLLDAITIALAAATLFQWGDSDLILDALWVTIAIGAFLFGLRASLVRIVIATIHPSAVLRGRTAEDRRALRRRLVGDLRLCQPG